MRNKILILLSVLVVLVIVAGILFSRHQHTVSDFDVFPCEFSRSDEISVETEYGEMRLKREGGRWAMTEPVQEALEPGALMALNRFISARMYVDDRRKLTQDEKKHLSIEKPTHLTFLAQGETLCRLELGQGIKLPTVDSERRWVFMGEEAYRAFVPLFDFGPFFEQPVSGWRQREWLSLSMMDVTGIEIWTQNESFRVERTGVKTESNPQGWRLSRAEVDLNPQAVDDFDLDERRVATILELVTPFYVDDWADGVEDKVKNPGGRLTIETEGHSYVFYIGEELIPGADKTKSWLGEGARYMRRDGDRRTGVVMARRLMGIFPSLDEMRTKRVWKLDLSQLAAIEIEVGGSCVEYYPGRGGKWNGRACGQTEDDARELDAQLLGNYIKTLESVQAVRYATPEERKKFEAGEAELRVYMHQERELSYRLKLSEAMKGLYRYGQVLRSDAGGEEEPGPVFVITEGILQVILSDLRSDDVSIAL